MMKQAFCIEPRTSGGQRGDALLEALVGILLMAIIGLGMSYVAGRVFVSQRYTSTQNIAVLQMRNLLSANSGLEAFCTAAANISITLNPLAQSPTLMNLPAKVNCIAASPISVAANNPIFNQTIIFRTQLTVSTLAADSDSATRDKAIALFGGDGIVTVRQ